MKVFAHRAHSYLDRARGQEYVIPQGAWREVPDGVGLLITEAHPGKLCDVSSEDNPDRHTCPLTPSGFYEDREMVAPPQNTAMEARSRLSPQKKRVLKAARQRSRLARIGANGNLG